MKHPENIEAMLLGCPLITQSTLDRIVDQYGFAAAELDDPRHRLIFEAMLDLRRAGEMVDTITVCARLEREGKLDDAGGAAYVHSLPTMVVELSESGELVEAIRLCNDYDTAVATGDLPGWMRRVTGLAETLAGGARRPTLTVLQGGAKGADSNG